MKRRRDLQTPDLFKDYQPPAVVSRFSPERIKAVRVSARIKRAVAEAIRDCGLGREVIAQQMSAQLGEPITPAQLDQYTSTANEKNNIPTHRFMALYGVTGDVRLINALLEGTGVIAVESKYEALIFREMAKEQREKLDSDIAAADAQWRGNR